MDGGEWGRAKGIIKEVEGFQVLGRPQGTVSSLHVEGSNGS